MLDPALNPCDDLAGIAFEPAPIELFGRRPELNDEVCRKVLGLDLAALLAPEAEECPLVIADDDASVRAADEALPAEKSAMLLVVVIRGP